MRRRLVLLGLAVAIGVPLLAAPILLAPGSQPSPSPAAPPIDAGEQARTLTGSQRRGVVEVQHRVG